VILIDVTVVVYAARREFDHHAAAHEWLTAALAGPEPVAVLDEVLAAAVRLLTNHRVLTGPLTGEEALAVCSAVRGAPAALTPTVGAGRWTTFHRLVTEHDLRANDVPDALLAATALDLGARLATFDRGFRRFSGLDVVVPRA
jgi:toxin-antitoxin system PIN domain toxin